MHRVARPHVVAHNSPIKKKKKGEKKKGKKTKSQTPLVLFLVTSTNMMGPSTTQRSICNALRALLKPIQRLNTFVINKLSDFIFV